MGRREQRRVVRREAPVRRRWVAGAANALRESVADDHGACDEARRASGNRSERLPRLEYRRRERSRVKAALLRDYHRPLELVERPEPEPDGPRSVVVRIGGAGGCAPDLHAIDGLMEPAGLKPPVGLGHENAGWVP